MEQPHHDRSPEHRRARERRSFDDEASLLIQAGIDQALDHRRALDETTARLIAFALAASTVSNLTLFAQTGRRGPHTDNAALRAEYLPTYHDPNTPDDIRELIDWLGAHLITRENPGQALPQPEGPPLLRNLLWRTTVRVGEHDVAVSVRGDRPNDAVAALPDQLAPLLTTYGGAMITFLGLPDVDATSPHLEESFTDTYRGSYASPAEAIAQLTDLSEINAALTAIAARYTGAEFVCLDQDALWDRLCEVFDIIEIGGSYHVFDR